MIAPSSIRPPARLPADFETLARLAGVLPTHRAYDGTEQRVEPEVVVGVLQSLGVPIDGVGGATDALVAERATQARQLFPPVLVQRIGAVDALIPVPAGLEARGWMTLHQEAGPSRRVRIADVAEPGDGSSGSWVRVGALADGPLLPGYHEVALEGSGIENSALLIAAPRCPAARRGWGLFTPLYGVRSAEDWGVGSYRDLAELGRWTTSVGGSILGTLPLYPAFLEPPIDPSPYLPVTRLGYNELYVDPTTVPELAEMPSARLLLESDRFRARVAAARSSSVVDYEAVALLRREVLEPFAKALLAETDARELRAFIHVHPELLAYARFRAAGERHGRDWRRWSGAAAAEATDRPLDDSLVAYHACAQWLAWRQLGEAAQSAPIYGDLPVGAHPDGFDPFWEPEAFASGAHGGAPPDPFYAQGQDWAFPPLHPRGIRAQRYRHVIAYLRVAFAHAAALRVDHVMGLHRLYWIPPGSEKGRGAYVTYNAEELHALVALEAHRAGAVVVGEDLGTVDAGVREMMDRDRMLRSWVLEFKTSVAEPLPEPPEHCLASWGTHDVPRFAAFYRGATPGQPNASAAFATPVETVTDERGQWRDALTRALDAHDGFPADVFARTPLMEEGLALRGCLSHLAASPAALVLVDLADLWGELEQENRPGTGAEGSNWRRRWPQTLPEVRADPQVADLLALVDRERECSGPVEAALQ